MRYDGMEIYEVDSPPIAKLDSVTDLINHMKRSQRFCGLNMGNSHGVRFGHTRKEYAKRWG
jgi:hypothetical protein